MMAVHKDLQSVMETFAGSHDKLGNGYMAFTHIYKRTSQQNFQKVKKELENRSI